MQGNLYIGDGMDELSVGFTRTDTAFYPTDLFANGEDGTLYDVQELSSLFQDVAGSTPAVVGQPVARVNDLSGNGNHLAQATAASRFVLRQDDGGSYHLQGDGADDFMVTSGNLSLLNNFTMACAVQSDVVADGPQSNLIGVFGTSNSAYVSNGVGNMALRMRPNNSSVASISYRTDATSWSNFSLNGIVNKTLRNAVIGVFRESDWLARVNDDEHSGGTSGTFTTPFVAPIRLESIQQPVRFYGGLFVNRQLSANERALLSCYLQRQMGVAT